MVRTVLSRQSMITLRRAKQAIEGGGHGVLRQQIVAPGRPADNENLQQLWLLPVD